MDLDTIHENSINWLYHILHNFLLYMNPKSESWIMIYMLQSIFCVFKPFNFQI